MKIQVKDFKKIIIRMSEIIIRNEKYFCELDSAAGDGDFGMSLAKGFKEIQRQVGDIEDRSIDQLLMKCSMIITEYCGGATGPIWGGAFRSAAKSTQNKESLDLADVSEMFQAAIIGIQKRGGAKLGEKTLLDALILAGDALKKAADQKMTFKEAFKMAAASARVGAELTKSMVAAKGRASYLGERSLNHPDAGAVAVSVIFNEMIN
ncbi:MAG: dihydroxyacetone kinase subunit DhaL [Christensenellales bacterium]|jgi:dihydroxyacetone kinase-like protein